jgi:DNA repair protein RecO (recombination protein O)
VARIQTQALILRSIEFGESDLILHLLAPDVGRLPVIAKGARRSVRRFSGTLDLFNHIRVHIDRRRANSLARLDQASLIDPFLGIRQDVACYALASYLLELFNRLAPEGGVRADTRRLFSFALGALGTLSRQTPDTRLRTLLEFRALDALGLRPEFSRCVRCGSTSAARSATYFHIQDGGVVCEACGSGVTGLLRVQPGTLRALEQGLRFELDQLDRLAMSAASLAEAHQLLVQFQRFHVGVELRSGPFLDRVCPLGSI